MRFGPFIAVALCLSIPAMAQEINPKNRDLELCSRQLSNLHMSCDTLERQAVLQTETAGKETKDWQDWYHACAPADQWLCGPWPTPKK